MEIQSIFERMRKDQAILKQKAEMYIRYMLNGRRKKVTGVTLWGPDTIKIYFRSDIGVRGEHVVDQKQFISKVDFYSRDKGEGTK